MTDTIDEKTFSFDLIIWHKYFHENAKHGGRFNHTRNVYRFGAPP